MKGKHLAGVVVLILVLVGSGLAQLRPSLFAAANAGGADMRNQMQMQMPMDMSGPADQGIPSYHAYELKPPFPVTLDPKQFPDALNRNVYALAAKIKPVLFQQPCYCYCDRHDGHKSLLDCYVTKHGAECDICQKEAVFAYQMTRKGKTPAQIRAAIIQGGWKSVNLNPYMVDLNSH